MSIENVKFPVYDLSVKHVEFNPDALVLFRSKMSEDFRIKDYKKHSRLYPKGGKSTRIVLNEALKTGEWRVISKDGSVLDSGNIVQDIRNNALKTV